MGVGAYFKVIVYTLEHAYVWWLGCKKWYLQMLIRLVFFFFYQIGKSLHSRYWTLFEWNHQRIVGQLTKSKNEQNASVRVQPWWPRLLPAPDPTVRMHNHWSREEIRALPRTQFPSLSNKGKTNEKNHTQRRAKQDDRFPSCVRCQLAREKALLSWVCGISFSVFLTCALHAGGKVSSPPTTGLTYLFI